MNSGLLDYFTFDNHVEGKSNQIARARHSRSARIRAMPTTPVHLRGVGLGKTHLMQATGNEMRKHFADAKVMFITAERFVNHMVTALKSNSMNDFQKFYRSLDALLMTISSFRGKDADAGGIFSHLQRAAGRAAPDHHHQRPHTQSHQ